MGNLRRGRPEGILRRARRAAARSSRQFVTQHVKDTRSEVGVIVTARECERFVQPLLRSLIVVRYCVEFGGREQASRRVSGDVGGWGRARMRSARSLASRLCPCIPQKCAVR